MNIHIKDLEVHVDNRGWVSEILRKEVVDKKEFGQILVTTAYPNIVKGNHYHKRKTEWYCVIKGKMKLVLRDNETEEVNEFILGDKKLQTIEISPGVSHGFRNIGDEMLYVLIYINEPFNPKDPDTFPSVVVE